MPFISISQQKVLLLIYDNKKIDFKNQEIYAREQSFERAMKQLCNAGFLRKIKSNNFRNEYLLTLDGIFIVEDVIKHFIKNNA